MSVRTGGANFSLPELPALCNFASFQQSIGFQILFISFHFCFSSLNFHFSSHSFQYILWRGYIGLRGWRIIGIRFKLLRWNSYFVPLEPDWNESDLRWGQITGFTKGTLWCQCNLSKFNQLNVKHNVILWYVRQPLASSTCAGPAVVINFIPYT